MLGLYTPRVFAAEQTISYDPAAGATWLSAWPGTDVSVVIPLTYYLEPIVVTTTKGTNSYRLSNCQKAGRVMENLSLTMHDEVL
jgi:hypothetical protein